MMLLRICLPVFALMPVVLSDFICTDEACEMLSREIQADINPEVWNLSS